MCSNAFDMTPKTMEAFLALMERRRPTVLRGYTTAPSSSARYALDHGCGVPELRAVLTTAEQCLPWQRECCSGPSVHPCSTSTAAARCRGLPTSARRIRAARRLEHAIVEIVDESGHPKPHGEVGRVVLTGLDNWPCIHSLPER